MSYIERESLLNEIQEELDYVSPLFGAEESKYIKAGLRRAKKVIEKHPTADVVEVVRCKDCIYAKFYERAGGKIGYYCQNNNSTFRYGTNWERLYQPVREADDYCSCGERSEKCSSN